MRAKKKLLKFAWISHTSRISYGGKGEAARPEGTMCGAAGTRMGFPPNANLYGELDRKNHFSVLYYASLTFSSIFQPFGDFSKFSKKSHFSDHPKSRIWHPKSTEIPSIFEIPAQEISNFGHGFQLPGAVSRDS